MQSNSFQALQQWYLAQCDGEWEHSYGVHIATLDNPGWLIKIDLHGTALADVLFHSVAREHESDWFNCRRTDTQFVAAGGPLMLDELLAIFIRWASDANAR